MSSPDRVKPEQLWRIINIVCRSETTRTNLKERNHLKIIIKISGSRPCRSILNYEATLRLIIKQSMARKLSNDDPTVSDNTAAALT